MKKMDLADTVLQLLGDLQSPPGMGLYVTELEVNLPLEVSTAVIGGELVFQAQPPHSRWQSGFLPPVQRTRLKVALEET